ncbi:MAG: hypothetical protein PWQ95_1978 [Thermococcaceae archaeon]|nr:hypothetical protein [Thermococcaceae archaeon]
MNILKRPLSWEERNALYAILVVSAVFLTSFIWIVGSIITHEAAPFEVVSPKGKPVLVTNTTIEGVNYTNSVVIFGGDPMLTFASSKSERAEVRIKILTEGWCMDLWRWDGDTERWRLKKKCVRELSLDYYAFSHKSVKDTPIFFGALRGVIFLFSTRRDPFSTTRKFASGRSIMMPLMRGTSLPLWERGSL